MEGPINYTKKVMQYFLHPKNVGEIKNADGVGKIGNPVCLLPEEKIHKNSELKEIANLEKSHDVMTHTGHYESIINTSSRDYAGKIISLQNKLGKIKTTPEHLVFAMKILRGQKFQRNKGKKQLIPSWHHAGDLEKGDIVLYPILKKEKDLSFLEINIPKSKYDFKSKEIPNKIPLNSDLLRLFGYFLAEGNIQNKPCKNYISFTLNIKEKDIASDIRGISKKLFGLDIAIKERPETKTAVVFLYNAKLARWFKSLFGNGAEHKKLPDFIMNLPVEKQKSLILGLWRGDGYANLSRIGPRAGYATISYQLAQQLKILLLRQKIAPSIYEDNEREVKGVKHNRSYRIHVGQRDSLIKICSILGLKYSPKSYASVDSWFDNNYLYTPITKKESLSYSGQVNNLEVENSHSFVSEAFCLHNCGDIMYVFIKIGMKGKEEFIKDIKFKTLGCGAAIATSSVVTELAKGKTLKKAMKITNNDVVKFLGGLPPVKHHCSLLAEEALGEAIYDYLSKNKRAIPKELQIKHKIALREADEGKEHLKLKGSSP